MSDEQSKQDPAASINGLPAKFSLLGGEGHLAATIMSLPHGHALMQISMPHEILQALAAEAAQRGMCMTRLLYLRLTQKPQEIVYQAALAASVN